MSDSVLRLGTLIPIKCMIGSRPVSALYSGQAQIWSPKKPASFVKAEGDWAMDVNVFTSKDINGGESTIEKVYFKNLGGKTITITYDFEASPYDANFYIFTLDSETEILTTENDGTAYGECGRTGSADLTFPDDEEHFICLKYSKWDECEPWGRDNVIVTFSQELFGEVKWIVVGEVIRYEYENDAPYKCVYQDLQLSFNGVLMDKHMDGELISKEPTTATITSPNDTIKLDDVSYGFWVPEVDPNKVYNLSFDSPTSIVFGNPIKISSWNIVDPYRLREIIGLNFVDTSNMTDMNNMFNGCGSLTSLDVSNFNTSNVTNMSWMFVPACLDDDHPSSALTSLNGLSGWDTSSVTDMSFMFYYCSKLTSLDVSNFNTSNVTTMRHMFDNCGVTSLDLSNFNTSSVTDMSYIFYCCGELTSLDVSGWDTSNVADMSGMFSGCRGLTSLDVSGWDTSNVTSMNSMFAESEDEFNYYPSPILTSLDLSNFNTSKVTDMRYMFCGCRELTSLDVSGWDVSQMTNYEMESAFRYCNALTTVIGPITGISTNIDLSHSPLTHDSAMVFMNGLNTVTETRSITFKKSTYDTLTEAEIAAATAKGWTIQSAA